MEASTKNALIICVAIALVGSLMFYGLTYSYWTAEGPGKYTDVLSKIRVQDDTGGTLITSNVNVGYYSQDADASGRPVFGRYSTLNPTTSASYDSVKGFWVAGVTSATYTMVAYDSRGAGSATYYPTKFSITVPSTNSETLEVIPSPSTAHLSQRATIAKTLTITGYNTTGGFSTSNLDVRAGATKNNYTSFLCKYEFTLSGVNKLVQAGRIYFTKITELPVTRVLVNGVEAAVGDDTTAADDGLTGYYVEFETDWQGGAVSTPTTVNVNLYLTYNGGLTADTSFTMTLADCYAVQRTTIKWWTYVTQATVVDAT